MKTLKLDGLRQFLDGLECLGAIRIFRRLLPDVLYMELPLRVPISWLGFQLKPGTQIEDVDIDKLDAMFGKALEELKSGFSNPFKVRLVKKNQMLFFEVNSD